jgi:predicted 3-demethylubiquinone-9 3-methyltransferase (glyoxalase superfamily)
MQKLTPFLWYNNDIREVMDFYRSVFPSAKVSDLMPGPDGSLMGATFELDGQKFIAFNGGPHYTLSPAVSMYISCETQEEIDELYGKLVEGGEETRCGWLVDRFGLSWQIIPSNLQKLLGDPDRARADRAMKAMLQMKKLNIQELERAAAGVS